MPSISLPGKVLFPADGTSMLVVDSVFPLIYRWSLPDEPIWAVRQTMLDFIAALQVGDYVTAVGLYQPLEEDLLHYESLGLDSGNLPAVLEYICAQPSLPCDVAVGEILFEGQELDGTNSLMLSFVKTDGSQYVDEYGESIFWFYATQDDTGGASILSLPSFLYGQ